MSLEKKQTSDRWAEKAKLIVNSMALIGYNKFYEDSPVDMEDGEIEAYIWRKIALNMLKNIKFPAELYQICNAIACMSDDKLEEMLK